MVCATIAVIGAWEGRKEWPIIAHLVRHGSYRVKFLTHTPNAPRPQALLKLGPDESYVELVEGDASDEADVQALFAGCDGVYVNLEHLDAERAIPWGIRLYELAMAAKVDNCKWGQAWISPLCKLSRVPDTSFSICPPCHLSRLEFIRLEHARQPVSPATTAPQEIRPQGRG
jgi:hypothetical protein